MESFMFGLYLKWNLLLGAAYLLWLFTRKFATISGLGLNHQRQLRIARWLFAALIPIVPLMLALQALQPALQALPANIVAGEMLIGSTIDRGLAHTLELGRNTFGISAVLLLFLLAGMSGQLYRLLRQIGHLRHILGQSAEWKRLGPVSVLFSPAPVAPFSTRAFGSSQIVLPYDLMKAPRHLRLVVKHELQHSRNGDLDWVLLLEAIKVLCFWNPAIHLWHSEFDCLQEFACDEAVLEKGGVNARTYGHCLLDVASDGPGATLIAASSMVPRFSLLRPHRSQLKRRIHMLGEYKAARPSMLKSLSHLVPVGGGLMFASLLVFGAEPGSTLSIPERGLNEYTYFPASTAEPGYPQRALDEKLEGWVHVNLTVNAEGKVEDAEVIDGCVSKSQSRCMPDEDVFHAISLATVEKFAFEPRVENGLPVATHDVQYVFRFMLGNQE